MENRNHLYRLSQPLLDTHHRGMPAEDAARELASSLFNRRTTGLDVLVMMFDDAARANLGRHQPPAPNDLPIERMLTELITRLHRYWLKQGSYQAPEVLFSAARDFIDARSTMIDAYRTHRKVQTLKPLNIDAMQCLDASDALYQRATYFSRAEGNLRSLASGRMAALFLPLDDLSAGARREEELTEAQLRLLAGCTDRELGVRIMHSLRGNRLATYDPTYPVDGVRSIYVLVPLLISYLTHPSAELEARMPLQLAELQASLTELAAQMASVNRRYARLQGHRIAVGVATMEG